MAEGDAQSGRRPGHSIQKLIAFTTTTATAAATAVTTATAAATAAATTTATAEITARTAVATAPAGRTFFLRTGNVDRQRTTVELRAVHGRDGLLRFLGRGVGDEGETA